MAKPRHAGAEALALRDLLGRRKLEPHQHGVPRSQLPATTSQRFLAAITGRIGIFGLTEGNHIIAKLLNQRFEVFKA